MTYKKLTSTRITDTQTAPVLVYRASVDTIVSKIYVHNPEDHTDARVRIYFVDKKSPNEYDSATDTINENITQAFDILIPGLDTVSVGSGVTLSSNQCIYAKSIGGNATIHIFGKTLV